MAAAEKEKEKETLDLAKRKKSPYHTSAQSPYHTIRPLCPNIHFLQRLYPIIDVLNASRRFRYTLDLRKNEDQEKKEEDDQVTCSSHKGCIAIQIGWRTSTWYLLLNFPYDKSPYVSCVELHIISLHFPIHIVLGTTVSPPSPSGGYGISLEQLISMTRDHNISAFHQYGGQVKGLSEMLKTDADREYLEMIVSYQTGGMPLGPIHIL
ncbi:hypothetical protein OSB04_004472 [Centaurea solstitialis]|uniref:Uncharacterized protein n=1 Tax=Centaurea solstitialis TaxID=347529 RepID=A0AA38WVY0_9ASTR|nr:hypothetical protein OSB04_004472 [Centaurea solstitialis]